MKKSFCKLIGAGLMALALSGCGPLIKLPGSGPAPMFYSLTPPALETVAAPREATLLVEEPLALGGLGGDRIALTPARREMSFFAHARWRDRAPRLMLAALIETLEDSKAFKAVIREGAGLRSDYRLKLELRDFQAEYAGAGAPRVHVRLYAMLIGQPRGDILATRQFDHAVPAGGTDMAAIVGAFDEALGGVLGDAAHWVLRETAPSAPTPNAP